MFARVHDETTLYFEDFGRGVPVLCLPAFPFDHTMFRGQYVLEDAARLILPDYRGTGRSELTAGPYTMEMLAGDMFALLDHVRADRAVVLGVSMGAYVAFAMLALRPERIRGLIIADSRADADSPETARRRRETVDGLRTRGTEVLRERVNNLFSSVTRREQPERVEDMQLDLLQQPAEGLAQITLGLGLRPDRTELLSHIQAPALVICGEDDAVSPPEVMRRMASAIPGANYQVIRQAGHLALWEKPEEANYLVRDFLKNLPIEE